MRLIDPIIHTLLINLYIYTTNHYPKIFFPVFRHFTATPHQVCVYIRKNIFFLYSDILRPQKLYKIGNGKTPSQLHYYPSLPLCFPLPMESCSFRAATAPSPFPSAPSPSSSPRAPCPILRFPVGDFLLRLYNPRLSGSFCSQFFFLFFRMLLCRGQKKGGRLGCGGGRPDLMPSRLSPARSSWMRCFLYPFVCSILIS
jgi:hypothetical protein